MSETKQDLLMEQAKHPFHYYQVALQKSEHNPGQEKCGCQKKALAITNQIIGQVKGKTMPMQQRLQLPNGGNEISVPCT